MDPFPPAFTLFCALLGFATFAGASEVTDVWTGFHWRHFINKDGIYLQGRDANENAWRQRYDHIYYATSDLPEQVKSWEGSKPEWFFLELHAPDFQDSSLYPLVVDVDGRKKRAGTPADIPSWFRKVPAPEDSNYFRFESLTNPGKYLTLTATKGSSHPDRAVALESDKTTKNLFRETPAMPRANLASAWVNFKLPDGRWLNTEEDRVVPFTLEFKLVERGHLPDIPETAHFRKRPVLPWQGCFRLEVRQQHPPPNESNQEDLKPKFIARRADGRLEVTSRVDEHTLWREVHDLANNLEPGLFALQACGTRHVLSCDALACSTMDSNEVPPHTTSSGLITTGGSPQVFFREISSFYHAILPTEPGMQPYRFIKGLDTTWGGVVLLVDKLLDDHTDSKERIVLKVGCEFPAVDKLEVEEMARFENVSQVPHLLHHFHYNDCTLMDIELVPDGIGWNDLAGKEELTTLDEIWMASEVFRLLAAIHELNFVHCDIHGWNIMISGHGKGPIWIIDFNSGNALGKPLPKEIETLYKNGLLGWASRMNKFRAPESNPKDYKTWCMNLSEDVWAAAILLAELCLGKELSSKHFYYKESSYAQLLQDVEEARPLLGRIVVKGLIMDHEVRPMAQDLYRMSKQLYLAERYRLSCGPSPIWTVSTGYGLAVAWVCSALIARHSGRAVCCNGATGRRPAQGPGIMLRRLASFVAFLTVCGWIIWAAMQPRLKHNFEHHDGCDMRPIFFPMMLLLAVLVLALYNVQLSMFPSSAVGVHSHPALHAVFLLAFTLDLGYYFSEAQCATAISLLLTPNREVPSTRSWGPAALAQCDKESEAESSDSTPSKSTANAQRNKATGA
eukprot:g11826.t1